MLLDVGGVLVIPHAEAIARALGAAGIDHGESFEHAHYAGVRAVDEVRGEGEDRERYLRGYVNGLGVPRDDIEPAIAALFPVWRGAGVDLWRQVLPQPVADLAVLRQAGLRLGIVSNADGTVEEQLRRSRICQIGEGIGVPVLAIVDSGVTGVAKPDPDVFAPALQALDLDPSDVAYVGDSVRYDVAAAAAAGLAPFHFDPHDLCADNGHRHLTRLAELV